MKRNSASLRHSSAYTSPGTPGYGGSNEGGGEKGTGTGMPRGWTSERLALPADSSRRHVDNSSALMPFYSGRALPSKWDDAERWITSPVSGYGVCKNPVSQLEKHPKSKSGPLGTSGLMYLPNYSPPVPALEGGTVGIFMAGSPFTAGVLIPDGCLCGQYDTDRPGKVHQLSDLLIESSRPSSSEESDSKVDGAIDEGTMVSRVFSRRDMATQMSPDCSTHSSPIVSRSLCSTTPSSASKQQQLNSVKVEIRDVQVDKGVAIAKQFKKHGLRKAKKTLNCDPNWNIAQGANNTSKLEREEARIAAWENLQKAKAEAAIQKLEMKLEKKRSESMDKILNKLQAAEMKAREMRSSKAESFTPRRAASFREYVKMSSFCACFFCYTG